MRKICWLCILLVSCSAGKRKARIPVNEMKVIMWDMIQAGEWFNVITVKDTTARKRKEDVQLLSKVLAVHGITREEFYNSYKYYEAHPVEFKVLIDSIDAYSIRERSRENEKERQTKPQ